MRTLLHLRQAGCQLGTHWALRGVDLQMAHGERIALVGANSQRLEIHDFTGRLMRALGSPALVIPSHADAYGDPNPTAAALADRKKFIQEVAASSPTSRTTARW